MNVYARALQVQARSIWAIALREVLVKHGRYKLGYIWELVRTGFMVSCFWAIREIGGFKPPSGIPVPIFLLMGFVAWFTFQETVNKSLAIVRNNRAMLAYPQVTPLDLYLASTLTVWVTQLLVMCIFLCIALLVGYEYNIVNFVGFAMGLAGVAIFALAVGVLLGSVKVYVPVLEKIVPMILRVMFFISGVFFSPEHFSKIIGDYFMWNPITNFIELLRSTFITSHIPGFIKLDYIVILTVVLLCLGMLIERHVRKITEQI